LIVDAHAHIFPDVKGLIKEGPTRGAGYGRVGVGRKQIQVIPPLCQKTIHTPEMLMRHMDWIGVNRVVLLQGPFYGECNQYVRDAVHKYPDRLIGLAYLDPWQPDSSTMFKSICESTEFVGVKIEFSEATGLCGIHPGAELNDPSVQWLWDDLEHHGLVVVIDLGSVGSASYQTEALRDIATSHSSLTIVIAHLAQPTPPVESDGKAWRAWQKQIDLGLLPNVFFDTASLPAYATNEEYPFPIVGRYLRIAIDRIGAAKVLWGTDIPALLAFATYSQLLQAARQHLEFLLDPERAMVLGGNAERVFIRRMGFREEQGSLSMFR
jgi:predicted TIM-barrel fold metal-dependent hydrolase